MDDDRVFSDFAAATLKAAGFRAVPAFDAMQGLMLAKRENPVAILLDLNMPAGGGFPLLDKIRQFPATRAIPVIVVTGIGGTRPEADAAAKGVDGFLAKPVEPDKLVAAVRAVLGENPPAEGG